MNAREELERLLENCNKTLKCASITYGDMWMNEKPISLILTVTHNVSGLVAFLNSLDFEYDAGYGGQEVFGTLWFTDGTWADRYEYDGSECWDIHELPEIPDECK